MEKNKLNWVFVGAYNASKAAVHAYSNTLRLELAPFNVKVVIIVTGGVQSRIARTRRDLPDDSLYLPVNDEYQRRLVHSQENAMPNESYAQSVVSQVLYTTPKKWIWEGRSSSTIWWFHSFIPNTFMVRLNRPFPATFSTERIEETTTDVF